MSRDFSGADQGLRIDSAVVNAAPFTISAWVRKDLATGRGIVVFIGDASSADDRLQLQLEPNNGAVRLLVKNTANVFAATSTNWVTGQWHHLCGIARAVDDRSVYLDGGGRGDNATSQTPVAGNVDRTTIGRRDNIESANAFDGQIGHVAIWDIDLTDVEIGILAAGADPRSVRPDNLIAYWPLNGRTPEPDIVDSLNLIEVNGPIAVGPEPPTIRHAILAPA